MCHWVSPGNRQPCQSCFMKESCLKLTFGAHTAVFNSFEPFLYTHTYIQQLSCVLAKGCLTKALELNPPPAMTSDHPAVRKCPYGGYTKKNVITGALKFYAHDFPNWRVQKENTCCVLSKPVSSSVGSCGVLVSLKAEAVNTDKVAELQTGLSDVQAAVTGAAECKHEWPFV